MRSHKGALKLLEDQIKAQHVGIFLGVGRERTTLWKFPLCVCLGWTHKARRFVQKSSLIAFRDGVRLGWPKLGLSAGPDIKSRSREVSVGRQEKIVPWLKLMQTNQKEEVPLQERKNIIFPSKAGLIYIDWNVNFLRNQSHWQDYWVSFMCVGLISDAPLL